MKNNPVFFDSLNEAMKGSGKMFLYWMLLIQLKNPQTSRVATLLLEDAKALKEEAEEQWSRGCQYMKTSSFPR